MVGTRQFDETATMKRALDVFRRKGLAATSMNDLALATGVHRGSLYNAYGGKDALFLTAFEAYAQSYLQAVRVALDRPDARAALTGFMDHVLTSMTSGSPARGCLSTRTAAESGESVPAVQARIRAWLDDLEEAIGTALRQNGLDAQLALPASETARLLVTFTRGLAVMERVRQDDAELQATAATLIRLLLREVPSR
jgi:AcrR family transcriptional regulator